MMTSGARGNILQIKQLIGMRGLMVDPQGKIMNTAIKNNLKEGLDILEYFISCYGARKGIIDTAIKTANSGYLTRKLVYAIQDQTIKKPDCKTNNKHIILNKKDKKTYYKLTIEAIIGRVTARDIISEKTFIGKNQEQRKLPSLVVEVIMKTGIRIHFLDISQRMIRNLLFFFLP